jgi:hypothetical protein
MARQFVRVGRPTDIGQLLMTLCFRHSVGFAYSRRTESAQPAIVTCGSERHLPRFRLADDGGRAFARFAARFVTAMSMSRTATGRPRGGG